MKMTKYHLERVVESANINNVQYIKQEIKKVLESNREYTRKTDYLGFSICSLDDKINILDEHINEMKEYKDNLKHAKSLALEMGASVFNELGIQKIEGVRISSISLIKGFKSVKTSLIIKDHKALIDAGFYKKIVDTESLLNSYNDDLYKDLIIQNCSILKEEIITSSKLKISKIKDIDNDRLTNIDMPNID